MDPLPQNIALKNRLVRQATIWKHSICLCPTFSVYFLFFKLSENPT